MASLYNYAGRQYAGVTGRTRKFPYRAFIEAQIPRLYEAKTRKEEKDIAERELGQTAESLGIEREGLDLEREGLEESKRVSDIEIALQREQQEQTKKQARVGTGISAAQTGLMAAYVGSKLLDWGAKEGVKSTTLPLTREAALEASKKAALETGRQVTMTGTTTKAGMTAGQQAAASAGLYIAGEAAGQLQPKVKEIPKESEKTLKGAGIGMAIGGPAGAVAGAGYGLAATQVEELWEPVEFVESSVEKVVETVTGGGM